MLDFIELLLIAKLTTNTGYNGQQFQRNIKQKFLNWVETSFSRKSNYK